MPVPAPLSEDSSGGGSYTRQYLDPLQRPYKGHVTAKRLDPPAFSVEADLVDGVLTMPLTPGRYLLAAMLRDQDGTRAFQTEEVTQSGVGDSVSTQEGS